MDRVALLDALVALAREAGLEVRRAGGRNSADALLPLQSGTCRVRGALWVVLCAEDPLDVRIDVLASALRSHGRSVLEHRFLPPALRERLTPEEFL